MPELLNKVDIEKRLLKINQNTNLFWKLEGKQLQKTFIFPDFISAFGFMTKVAIIAQSMDHHPNWSNVYNKVTVSLSTHSSGGITALDFTLAEAMEKSI